MADATGRVALLGLASVYKQSWVLDISPSSLAFEGSRYKTMSTIHFPTGWSFLPTHYPGTDSSRPPSFSWVAASLLLVVTVLQWQGIAVGNARRKARIAYPQGELHRAEYSRPLD
jgi:hypothetical protein